ncbi:hypothetical protein [Deinococcus radiotolerans]|nr:hypothetical protein [Deinococcus radiotolerans]
MTATLHRTTPTHLHAPLLPDPTAPLYSLEVIAPTRQIPHLSGWTLQAWPVASLGDLTLQARPHDASATPDDLRAALRAAGLTPLGPVRAHR